MGLAAVESKSRRKSWSKKAALLAEPQWSRYQNDIFDWVENGEGNLRIGAVAGSGKSTVLAAIVARLPSDAKIAILAFNKHIVDSMKGYRSDGTPRLPTRVTVTTAHSMGNALLSRVFEGMATIDNGKYRKIARPIIAALNVDPFVHNVGDVAKRWQKTAGVPQYVTYIVTEADRRVEIALVRRNWMKFALDLVRGCQSTLCIPHESGLKELIDYYGIEVPIGGELVISTIAEILNLGDSVAKDDHIIDFGDMLWLPHQWELQAASKDWLLIDEVQDANRAQLSLYEKCGRNGRVIVVGDADLSLIHI
jgi:superfamily I DNA/RNA helicase